MRSVPRRVRDVRVDHALLVIGSVVMSVASTMPWITGSTRMIGNLNWTGLDDTAEGAMLIGAALLLVAAVRWWDDLEGIDPRARFVPLAVGVASILLVGLALQKALYLAWWDLAVGARPQAGLFLAGLGAVIVVVGGVLAATDPASVARARAAAERERRSGAGGDGAASGRFRRGGGGRPPEPDEYSVVGRVERLSGSGDGDPAASVGRGSSPRRSS